MEILRDNFIVEDLECSSVSCQSSNSSNNSFMQHETRKNIFTAIFINACFLKDKLDSLKITLGELGADVCILTETWFKENT